MYKFIFDIQRDLKTHFLNLLTKEQKQDFFNNIEDASNEDWILDLPENEMYEEILNIIWYTVDEAIYYLLHYGLDIYFEVSKDEIWNTIPEILAIWKLINNSFSWVIVYNNTDNGYDIIYVWDNSIIQATNKYEEDEILKQYIWEENYNKVFLLIKDIMLYDESLDLYLWVNKEFEELYSNKQIYFNIEWIKNLIYINSTMGSNDIELYNE